MGKTGRKRRARRKKGANHGKRDEIVRESLGHATREHGSRTGTRPL